jgi:predicted dehydrogenase
MKRLPVIVLTAVVSACQSGKPSGEVTLITLDPGHFHAALVQKNMYPQVSRDVYVYAPAGDDLNQHLARIRAYNERQDQPTSWNEIVYQGDDFLEKMLAEKKGNVMVTAGNNARKTEYIKKTVDAGIHVLSDKPMAIDAAGFELLKSAFASAEKNSVLLYDIMTERFEITNTLQREFMRAPDVFGELIDGTPDEPAVEMESVHHIAKFVSGVANKRPVWYFDVKQQGEALADVGVHLIDLVQWECFPDVALDYAKDVEVLSARRWALKMSRKQFTEVTGATEFPPFLAPNVSNDTLAVFFNGEMNYRLKGKQVKIAALWNYVAPEGGGDTHYSMVRGTRARLVIKQGEEQGYQPRLYIEPVGDYATLEPALKACLKSLQAKYPGVDVQPFTAGWEVVIPDKYRNGHEAHFGQVTENFLQYLKDGKLPAWETPNMLAKYYTATRGVELSQ